MRILIALTASALLTLSVAGCNQQEPSSETQAPASATSVATAAPATTAPTTAAPAAAATAQFSVDPAQLQLCDKTMHVGTLTWDATMLPGVHRVEIWLAPRGKEPKLFAKVPAKGTKVTGNWVKAGSTFVLKDVNGGTELSRIEVAGVACP
jgi:hypothetical protein